MPWPSHLKAPPFAQSTDAPADFRCTGYGLYTCSAHDSGLQPYCNRGGESPSWCADSWCYVDANNCNKPFFNSVFFPGLSYSYFTCGTANTFDSWFGADPDSGEVTTHQLTELVELIQTYTKTISETLEENWFEAKQVRLTTSPPSSTRPPPTTTACCPHASR